MFSYMLQALGLLIWTLGLLSMVGLFLTSLWTADSAPCRCPSEQSRIGAVPRSSMPALLVVAAKHHTNT